MAHETSPSGPGNFSGVVAEPAPRSTRPGLWPPARPGRPGASASGGGRRPRLIPRERKLLTARAYYVTLRSCGSAASCVLRVCQLGRRDREMSETVGLSANPMSLAVAHLAKGDAGTSSSAEVIGRPIG
jgi:hypothetical protein